MNVTVIENGGSGNELLHVYEFSLQHSMQLENFYTTTLLYTAVLVASIFGATVALACGGMELYDLPVACSLVIEKSVFNLFKTILNCVIILNRYY